MSYNYQVGICLSKENYQKLKKAILNIPQEYERNSIIHNLLNLKKSCFKAEIEEYLGDGEYGIITKDCIYLESNTGLYENEVKIIKEILEYEIEGEEYDFICFGEKYEDTQSTININIIEPLRTINIYNNSSPIKNFTD